MNTGSDKFRNAVLRLHNRFGGGNHLLKKSLWADKGARPAYNRRRVRNEPQSPGDRPQGSEKSTSWRRKPLARLRSRFLGRTHAGLPFRSGFVRRTLEFLRLCYEESYFFASPQYACQYDIYCDAIEHLIQGVINRWDTISDSTEYTPA